MYNVWKCTKNLSPERLHFLFPGRRSPLGSYCQFRNHREVLRKITVCAGIWYPETNILSILSGEFVGFSLRMVWLAGFSQRCSYVHLNLREMIFGKMFSVFLKPHHSNGRPLSYRIFWRFGKHTLFYSRWSSAVHKESRCAKTGEIFCFFMLKIDDVP